MKQAAQHSRACQLLGVDPKAVRLVGPTEWQQIVGKPLGRWMGKSAPKHNIIYVNRQAGRDTYVHELLHILFPSRPHWWVFAAAWKVCGMHGGKWAYGAWQRASRLEDSQAHILKLAKTAAKRRGLAP